MRAVRVPSGSGFVRGNARKYSYVAASLFESHRTLDGRLIWRSTGIHSRPRRSERLAVQDGEELARQHAAAFLGVGASLHNRPVAAGTAVASAR